MSFLEYLSDDQIALIGCGLALVASFGLMSITFSLKQAIKPQSGPKPAGSQHMVSQTRSTDLQNRKAA